MGRTADEFLGASGTGRQDGRRQANSKMDVVGKVAGSIPAVSGETLQMPVRRQLAETPAESPCGKCTPIHLGR